MSSSKKRELKKRALGAIISAALSLFVTFVPAAYQPPAYALVVAIAAYWQIQVDTTPKPPRRP